MHISLDKTIKKWETLLTSFSPVIDERYLEEASLYENSLHDYMMAAWPIIEGGRKFVDGWHLQALCEHLEAVYTGQIKSLLVNVPPRTSKSTIISVGFPSWCWIKDPSLQFLYISYGLKLSIKDSIKCRRIISSNWFQERWKHKFRLSGDVNSKIRFDNNKTGYRISTSIDSKFGTGEGGDIIVLDDPNSASDANSETVRESTNDWCDSVLSSRLNDPETGRFIAVQQRLHSQDYSGHILSQEIKGLVHLCLPMEYESNRKCITVPLKSTNGIPWFDPRKKDGDLLWPERFSQESVDIIKKKMNSDYVVSGQLQQRPSPEKGGIFKKDDFQWWKEQSPPRCHFVLQSWDTAFSTSATASWSACTTWGLFKDRYNVDNIILLSLWRGKYENPDLRRMMLRLSQNYYDTKMDDPAPEDYIVKPDMILVEGKANGTPLMQDLNRAGLIINRFDPLKHGGGDKVARARSISHLIEAGRIWMPARPPLYDKLRPHADLFVEACAAFPNDDNSKDLVDSMSQAIIKFRLSGMIGHPDDAYITEEYNANKGKRFY